jgi:adenylyltransferase/sulfurtransferase
MLSKEELERYSRHIVIPEVGLEGQEKLKKAKVLIIGAGGLGSPLCLYLAAAGIGYIGIVDFDTVSISNLQRQILFRSSEAGKLKSETAKDKLLALNPDIQIKTHNVKLTKDNALEIMKDYDVIADGSDNFPTRYLVNDACVLLKKPFVYGSILRFNGQVTFFDSVNGPCYRCLYPEPPLPGEIPSCEEAGVLGALPGIIGSIQANEVIKYILGKGELLTGRLLMLDSLKMEFRELKIFKNDECPVCSDNPSITELIDYDEFCSNPALPELEHNKTEITVDELKEKMERGENFFLLDVREPFEKQIASLGGTLIPINSLQQRIDEIMNQKENEVIVYCRTGNRSHYAAEFLREKYGFKRAKNLLGGIHAWHDRIDSSIIKY